MMKIIKINKNEKAHKITKIKYRYDINLYLFKNKYNNHLLIIKYI